jgi:hypothetical protein
VLERLRAERPEIEHAIHTRVRGVAPGQEDESAEYEDGQFAAIVEALDYTLEGIEQGINPEQPIPPATMAQARRAARHEVGLDTILRRYHAAQSALASRLRGHIEQGSLAGEPAALRMLVDLQELHNLLTAEVAAEYAREITRLERSPAERRAGRIERLLSGASSDTRGLRFRGLLAHLRHRNRCNGEQRGRRSRSHPRSPAPRRAQERRHRLGLARRLAPRRGTGRSERRSCVREDSSESRRRRAPTRVGRLEAEL